ICPASPKNIGSEAQSHAEGVSHITPLLLLQLGGPVLHERQLLRDSAGGHDSQKSLSIFTGRKLPADAAYGQSKELFAAANLECSSRTVHLDCRNAIEVEVEKLLAV